MESPQAGGRSGKRQLPREGGARSPGQDPRCLSGLSLAAASAWQQASPADRHSCPSKALAWGLVCGAPGSGRGVLGHGCHSPVCPGWRELAEGRHFQEGTGVCWASCGAGWWPCGASVARPLASCGPQQPLQPRALWMLHCSPHVMKAPAGRLRVWAPGGEPRVGPQALGSPPAPCRLPALLVPSRPLLEKPPEACVQARADWTVHWPPPAAGRVFAHTST